jgi:excisionase family DNA binding protein
MKERFFTVDQAAEALNVGPHHLSALLERGELSGHQLPGQQGSWMIREDEIDALLDEKIGDRE